CSRGCPASGKSGPLVIPEPRSLRLLSRAADSAEEQAGEEADAEATPGWSPEELLREKDFGLITQEEMHEVAGLIAELAGVRPQRRSRRQRQHRRGRRLDMRRHVRASLATGGDPLERAFRRRIEGPRKRVVLCDRSRSMEA